MTSDAEDRHEDNGDQEGIIGNRLQPQVGVIVGGRFKDE